MPAKTKEAPLLFRLGPGDEDRYGEHLLRLDDEDRRFRFFADAPDFIVLMHAGAAASDGRIAFAFEEDGEIRAAGELVADPEHPQVGELAFSVEKPWRRRGLGVALMSALVEAGVEAGYERLVLEIMEDNRATQALALHFSQRTERRDGRVFATIATDRVSPARRS